MNTESIHEQILASGAELEIDDTNAYGTPYLITLTDEDGDTACAYASRDDLVLMHAALGRILETP